ncbi:hypothetical protein FRC11_008655, partial [Ceratobasidium sp. 423]
QKGTANGVTAGSGTLYLQDMSGTKGRAHEKHELVYSLMSSPTVGTSGHAKFATDEPERTPLVAAGHARSASAPHRKPIPMAMPVPAITKPTPPVANPPMTMPVPSPAAKPSPQSKPSPLSKPAPVPVPIPPKRNSSLLRKFRASGVGRTASG